MRSQAEFSTPRPVRPKTSDELAEEWDRIARQRHTQLEDRLDLSYDRILSPMVLTLLGSDRLGRVLDVGCGLGKLTRLLRGHASEVLGIDPSQQSIEIATSASRNNAGISYRVETVEEFSLENESKFDAVVANMVLMTMPDLDGGLEAIGKLLTPGGLFAFTITHPWFWPTYWGYDRKSWFNYAEEIFIEAPFEISLAGALDVTTHIHRPLGRYLTALRTNGFRIDRLLEPMPEPEVEMLYPKPWAFPRFLGARCSVP